jgi:hypothetical protein
LAQPSATVGIVGPLLVYQAKLLDTSWQINLRRLLTLAPGTTNFSGSGRDELRRVRKGRDHRGRRNREGVRKRQQPINMFFFFWDGPFFLGWLRVSFSDSVAVSRAKRPLQAARSRLLSFTAADVAVAVSVADVARSHLEG